MKRILIAATLVTVAASTAAAAGQPANHTLPACTNGATVWMDYRADTYTDDGGHTYGPATTLTCNPDGDNTVHIRYLPSTWTLADAHDYCVASGSVGAYTRFAATANVCPDVDI